MNFNKAQNVFTSTLSFLNVKYTKQYSNIFFNEHPHKYNLFGISKMLFDYGVKNGGIKIENKIIDIFNIQLPFIAQYSNSFVCVNSVNSKYVSYTWNGKNMLVSPEIFCESWSGFILLVEKTDNSIEPNYKENKRKEFFEKLQFITLVLIISSVFLIEVFFDNINRNWQLFLGVGINLLGLFISYLIILRQLKIHNQYADKICSIFHKSDCNNILDSNSEKFLGLINWSEVGFSYFFSNILIFIFFPQIIPVVAIFNVIALPYTVWSIWYQKIKIQQWCTLCLCIQLIIWLFFIISIVFNYFSLLTTSSKSWLAVISLYVVSFILINRFVSIWAQKSKIENLTQEFNSLKANEHIFSLLLKQQPYYKVNKQTSSIQFGNPEAKILITILTNPYCSPCAKMHERVEKILESLEEKICLQYIFSSFNEDLKKTNKNLIATYFQKDKNEVREIYKSWFLDGKKMKNIFFNNLGIEFKHSKVEEEFNKHEQWRVDTHLIETPTILVNGYQLPDNYKIEDLKTIPNLVGIDDYVFFQK